MLLYGPMMAHCITRRFVLVYDSQRQANIPVCDDWIRTIYEWVLGYCNKMRQDLISIGEWDRHVIIASSRSQANTRGVGVSGCLFRLHAYPFLR